MAPMIEPSIIVGIALNIFTHPPHTSNELSPHIAYNKPMHRQNKSQSQRERERERERETIPFLVWSGHRENQLPTPMECNQRQKGMPEIRHTLELQKRVYENVGRGERKED